MKKRGADDLASARAQAWRILGTPLTGAPDAKALADFARLPPPSARDECGEALAALAAAAGSADPEEVADDYWQLLVGLGRGKVVPYGSWHISGGMMDKPLAQLRDDLRALGLRRQDSAKEPEDHAGALCETMAALCDEESDIGNDAAAPAFARQKKIYDTHLSPWIGQFFADIAENAQTSFYRAFGEFGSAFAAFERRYFSMPF